MNPWQRTGAIAGALLLSCCGGLLGIGLLVGDPNTEPVNDTPADPVAAAGPAPVESAEAEAEAGTETDAPEPTATTQEPEATTPAPETTTPNTPVITKKVVKQTKSIPYETREVDDDSLAEGKSKVRVKGTAGVRTITYEITLTDGRETARKQTASVITKKPVTRVVAIGTKSANDGCDPNYTPCVPIASDVDCAGGSGNGPAYVDGPIRIIGGDPYDLDRDGDGVACDT